MIFNLAYIHWPESFCQKWFGPCLLASETLELSGSEYLANITGIFFSLVLVGTHSEAKQYYQTSEEQVSKHYHDWFKFSL